MPSENCYAYNHDELLTKVTSSTLNTQKVLTVMNLMEGDNSKRTSANSYIRSYVVAQ